MKKKMRLAHEFVEFIPENLKERTLYISTRFATVVHKCCCGCGLEVVTPLSPTGWSLIYDGETISLKPSIGNWNFPCRTHYLIVRSTVQWVRHRSLIGIETTTGQSTLTDRDRPGIKTPALNKGKRMNKLTDKLKYNLTK